MAEDSCGICLDDLKNPVSTPCGHLHCEKCLVAHIEANSDAITASCPSCRADFPIATPDLRFVPAKYHRFIIPGVRRVFLDVPAESAKVLKSTVARLEERVRGLEHDKTLLMERCEATMAASTKHAEGERDARVESAKLGMEIQELRKKYDVLKGKYRVLKDLRGNDAPHQHQATKRNRSEASLDSSGASSSASTSTAGSGSSSQLFRFGEGTDLPARPLRISKRPRLLGSPFDPAKVAAAAPPTRPAVFKKGRTSVLLSLDDTAPRRILGTPEHRSISSASGSSARSTGPRRSGLLTGDLFSPESNRTLNSSADFRIRAPGNVLIEDDDDD